ncbi:TMAO reductase system periplasmic protein TorT [Rhodobacteraceae bacterium B1Z28]|uniref:TMAO reductase system periplasmic protein TorT n=2 Tax=Ruegeria haliotis TaxID=2747601 RepID=A0ABX2PXF8_9RHOB|nr:TMAO reductase system periplasmic protein TorT [Ruegeria haliotis]
MGKPYSPFLGAAIGALVLLTSAFNFARPATAKQQMARRICVVVPHFKDEYWLSVGYGLKQEALKTETELLIYESGGYHTLDRQITLLEDCVNSRADAILFGAVSADDPALLDAVERTSKLVPVVALVNELRSPHLSGAVGVDWHDMGVAIGQYLAAIHPKNSVPISAALITGSLDSGWSPILEAGLQEGLKESSVVVLHTGRSDTGMREQLVQVEAVLNRFTDIDLIIGSAPAIEGAMGLVANSEAISPSLVSTYISHSVYRGLLSKAVDAVAFDDPVQQGRMGISVALSAQKGRHTTEVIGPEIELAVSGAEHIVNIDLSPADFRLDIE